MRLLSFVFFLLSMAPLGALGQQEKPLPPGRISIEALSPDQDQGVIKSITPGKSVTIETEKGFIKISGGPGLDTIPWRQFEGAKITYGNFRFTDGLSSTISISRDKSLVFLLLTRRSTGIILPEALSLNLLPGTSTHDRQNPGLVYTRFQNSGDLPFGRTVPIPGSSGKWKILIFYGENSKLLESPFNADFCVFN